MKNLITKIKKVPWVLAQPLTKKPDNLEAKISDLFVWRVGKDWNTYFELLDICTLFGTSNNKVNIVFFDTSGNKFLSGVIALNGLKRQILDIADFLHSSGKSIPTDCGTFCVFHQQTPEVVQQLNAFIAERGYISYQYKDAPLRSFVHGNLDAISEQDNQLTVLAGSSFLKRKYNLQYVFTTDCNYEMALVNASNKTQNVVFEIISTKSQQVLETQYGCINEKSVLIFPISQPLEEVRIVIISKMIMARPMIFRFENDRMDVLHG
jgi:hypothetical protein